MLKSIDPILNADVLTRCAPRAMATTSSSVTQIFRPRRPRARPCWGGSSAPSAARRCDAGEQNNAVLAMANVRFARRVQPVAATHSANFSAGV
jgi:hypothetical protein